MTVTANEHLTTPEVARLIGESFARSDASRLPKHVRLYDAISANVDAGRFPAGQKLPGERELSTSTGISLGTVQKGLGQLAADRRIHREHGRGTFVRAGQLPLTDLWHYRFSEPKGTRLLPVFARLAERAQVLGDADVVNALGKDASRYVRICRVINIDDRFRCWSEMHLPFSRFGDLLHVAQADIESVNLKQLLALRFKSPTLATTQTVRVQTISADIAQHIGVKPRSAGLLLQIVGTSRGGLPITFQRIQVPPSECEMEIGAEAKSAKPATAATAATAAAAA